MKKRDIKFSTGFIIGFIIFSMATVGYQIVLKNLVVDILNIKSDFVVNTISSVNKNNLSAPKDIDINWEEEYPFEVRDLEIDIEVQHTIENEGYCGLRKKWGGRTMTQSCQKFIVN